MIKTIDNFYGSYSNIFHNKTKYEIKKCNDDLGYSCYIDKYFSSELNITLGQYLQKSNDTFICSFTDEEVLKNNNELIISIFNAYDPDSQNEYLSVETGNYLGKFEWTYSKNKQLEINIKSRFSDVFLKRMLNFANDVFLDDVSVFDAKEDNKNDLDYSKFIIYYMFIQKLEKSFLLGLPKAYRNIYHHEMNLKGKVDINRFIKHDIPFKGKISSVSREQKEIQEVIDVLYKAIKIIDKNDFSTKNISHIKTHLNHKRSNNYVSNETIMKAINSKALQNPIYRPYKKVLEYAKFIIDASNLEEQKNGNEKTFGFLVNVAELFEIYLTKLLQHRMPDWEVIHEPKLHAYDKPLFYNRHMYPDIVMKKDNKVMVFDAKYKRMKFRSKNSNGAGDLDRSDFFQINTYMTYYDKQGYKVLAGGLLYPIEKNMIKILLIQIIGLEILVQDLLLMV